MQTLRRYFYFFVRALRRAGVRATVGWAWFRFRQLKTHASAGDQRWSICPTPTMHPVSVRLGKTSDLRVFEDIFLVDEYSRLRALEDVFLVLDLGANVGFSSAYFLSAFPKAKVVAVEPDTDNCTACAANLAPYGSRAVLVCGAVWTRRTKLRFSETSVGVGNEWGRQMEESPQMDAAVEAWDVASLIDIGGFEKADMVKIDIEGGEAAIFGKGADKTWLSRVRNICIELHGQECKEAFFKALEGFDYQLSYSHELTICTGLRAK